MVLFQVFGILVKFCTGMTGCASLEPFPHAHRTLSFLGPAYYWIGRDRGEKRQWD
jgi:hypothetical protein